MDDLAGPARNGMTSLECINRVCRQKEFLTLKDCIYPEGCILSNQHYSYIDIMWTEVRRRGNEVVWETQWYFIM